MSDLITELPQRARKLPPHDRARLAEELLASLGLNADAEVDAEAHYYEEKSTELGERFLLEIEAAIELTATFSEIGSPYKYGAKLGVDYSGNRTVSSQTRILAQQTE